MSEDDFQAAHATIFGSGLGRHHFLELDEKKDLTLTLTMLCMAMVQPVLLPTGGGVSLPLNAEGNDANASGERVVTAAVSVDAHIYLASSLISLIDTEARAASSSAEQEEASASSPPQLPPIDATTDDNTDGVGVASMSCDFTDVNSVNESYPVPVQDGKSKRQINVFNLNKLNKLETAEQKDRFQMRANKFEHAALMVE